MLFWIWIPIGKSNTNREITMGIPIERIKHTPKIKSIGEKTPQFFGPPRVLMLTRRHPSRSNMRFSGCHLNMVYPSTLPSLKLTSEKWMLAGLAYFQEDWLNFPSISPPQIFWFWKIPPQLSQGNPQKITTTCNGVREADWRWVYSHYRRSWSSCTPSLRYKSWDPWIGWGTPGLEKETRVQVDWKGAGKGVQRLRTRWY